jgi:hypothetical protein
MWSDRRPGGLDLRGYPSLSGSLTEAARRLMIHGDLD